MFEITSCRDCPGTHEGWVMARLGTWLAIIGIAYWYWSGPYYESEVPVETERLQDNAAIMQRCIKQEERLEAAGISPESSSIMS
jgi:hypothetical protein